MRTGIKTKVGSRPRGIGFGVEVKASLGPRGIRLKVRAKIDLRLRNTRSETSYLVVGFL